MESTSDQVVLWSGVSAELTPIRFRWEGLIGATGDFVGDAEGRRRFNGENVQRARLRIDTRKWIASKLKPTKYGERVDLSHGVRQENPLAVLIQQIQRSTLKIRSDEDIRAARIIDHHQSGGEES